MNKTLGVALVAVVIAIVALVGNFSQKEVVQVGAAAGTDFTESTFFRGGATIGSSCFSTTTTGTLTTTQLEKNSCIRIAPAGAGQAVLSLTLPASTTLASLLPVTGACRSWHIDAGGVAAGTTTTFVAGAGIDLVGQDATGAGAGADVLDGAEFGLLQMCRQSDGDVTAFIDEYIAAD